MMPTIFDPVTGDLLKFARVHRSFEWSPLDSATPPANIVPTGTLDIHPLAVTRGLIEVSSAAGEGSRAEIMMRPGAGSSFGSSHFTAMMFTVGGMSLRTTVDCDWVLGIENTAGSVGASVRHDHGAAGAVIRVNSDPPIDFPINYKFKDGPDAQRGRSLSLLVVPSKQLIVALSEGDVVGWATAPFTHGALAPRMYATVRGGEHSVSIYAANVRVDIWSS